MVERSKQPLSGARILVLAVSNRLDSETRKLARMVEETARGMWVDTTLADSGDYPMPLCDCDLDPGQPPPHNAMKLSQLIREHHGLIVVTPERSASIPASLKNMLDWLASPMLHPDGDYPFKRKLVALMSAQTHASSSLGLVHLRDVLASMKMHVLPEIFILAEAHNAFARNGKIKDGKHQARVAAMVEELILMAERMRG